MKRKIVINIIVIVSALMCVAGCARELLLDYRCETVISMNLSPVIVSGTSMDSKAVKDPVDEGVSSDYAVADFWFFEYDASDNLIGTPRYYSTEDFDVLEKIPISVILPSSAGVVYKAIVIANTHNPSFLSSVSYNTLAALKSSAAMVRSSADLCQGNDLLMNGAVDIMASTSSIDCFLFRNVAKLSLTIRNEASSGLVINSVQLKNIPDRLFVADQFYADETVFPDASVVDYVNLEKDILNLQEDSETHLLYYLPRNMQGTNNSTTEAGKNVNAPANATYVEISATRKDSYEPMRYRLYPGANDINDFNIKSNHLYELVVDFNKSGDVNDNRVEDMSFVKLEDSNSYLVNPSDGSNVRYVVPIENRINTFWKSESGQLNADWKDHLFGNDQEWVAEVIWQDINKQVIKFCNVDASLTDTYRGLADDGYFTFVTTDEAIGAPCNVVIGVRRASASWSPATDGYMWSWHIWITDYDPYEDRSDWNDDYMYPVANGSVQRYSSFDDIPMYANRYIMDRNLGAIGYTREDGYKKSAGMFYQYGRKDPFPTMNEVYVPSGNGFSKVSLVIASGLDADIYMSVCHPLTYFVSNSNWTRETAYNSYTWNDLKMDVQNGEGKSFFDPCPPGWQLPVYNIWLEFGDVSAKEAYAPNWPNNYSTSGKDDAGWLFYLAGAAKTGNTTYYPSAGVRDRSTGKYSTGNGGLWAASEDIGNNAYYFYYTGSGNNTFKPMQHPNYRAMGLPVRCITSRDAK